MKEILDATRRAAEAVAMLSDAVCTELLNDLADSVVRSQEVILEANARDLSRMDRANPLYDRLALNPQRLEGIAADMRHVAMLSSPQGKVLEERVLPNGLRLRRVSVPFGVVGVIYEARPNVTFDVFSLCLRSGNACILKGGKDADETNNASVRLIKEVLCKHGVDGNAVNLTPSTHEAAAELLGARGYVDIVIPRGGRRLIDFVRDNAKVPCIETGAGVVNTYFDASGDLSIGRDIVFNAKTRRVSVCNALDCLIVHSSRLGELPLLCGRLAEKQVVIYADGQAYMALEGQYPAALLLHADADSFGTEFMDYKMAVRVVDSLDEAIEHIARYGSGHSESIITEDATCAKAFQKRVDAACVYVNAPTSFTDGAQFGLGAEIGISTQKLGPRGPMGLDALNTYKWLIDGHGQVRP